jgi:hypothetical protein
LLSKKIPSFCKWPGESGFPPLSSAGADRLEADRNQAVSDGVFPGRISIHFPPGSFPMDGRAWGGSIVMNTRVERDQAFREYRAGTFIRSV